jgi:hypothetical protein
VAFIPTFLSFQFKAPNAPAPFYTFYYGPMTIAALVTFGVLWLLASRIANFAVRGHDDTVAVVQLSLEDLYRFAFVCIGLWFVLQSLGAMVRSGYDFFAYDFPASPENENKGRYLLSFLSQIAPFLGGLICILGMHKWTRLLLRLTEKTSS